MLSVSHRGLASGGSMNLFIRHLSSSGGTWQVLERCLSTSLCIYGTDRPVSLHKTSTRLTSSITKSKPQKQSKTLLTACTEKLGILRDPGVVTLEKLTKDQLVELLVNNVVYREGDLVAISKPQGLSIAGTDEVTLLSLLRDLGLRLGISEELHIIKAAAKESSGLVLLSSCHTTTKNLEDYFLASRKSKRPVSKYCAVLVGIPDPAEGYIVDALKSEDIGDQRLVIPIKNPSRGSLERREVKKTQTNYKVLDSSEGCSLVQLQPMRVFQCQLQVHATLMLCPVLGDHVYSARVGKVLGQPIFLPVEDALPRTQVLEEKLLQKMHISQKQMHRMPLHLHFHELLIQEPGSRRTKTLTAPPPPFFLRTLQLLGLTFNE